MVQKLAGSNPCWTSRQLKTPLLSTHPAVNWYFFESGKVKDGERKGLALPFIRCVQDGMCFKHPLPQGPLCKGSLYLLLLYGTIVSG